MDLLEGIKGRRSIRKYDSSRAVDDELLITCLEAARWAPSARNSQAWEFIVVKDTETREKLAKIHPYGSFMGQSPVVVIFLGNPEKHNKYYFPDTSVAIQNFLLAAHSLGLGTCWMGAFETDFEDEVKEMFTIPEHLKTVGFVSLGYSNHSPTKDRIPLNELVHFEKYGSFFLEEK